MKTMNYKQLSYLIAAILMPAPVFAQDLEVTPAADFVSSYVWRGTYCGTASLQPSLTATYGGLSLEFWGSTDFTSVAKEVDITLGYQTGGLFLGVTDYWWTGEGSRYGNYSNNHAFEGTVGYYFGDSAPLTLTWNTMFAGGQDKDEDGDLYYSTYIEATYDFNIKGVNLTAGIGVSPWTGQYHRTGTDGFALSTLSLRALKEIPFTDRFSLPVFAEVVFAPNQDNLFLVFGITL